MPVFHAFVTVDTENFLAAPERVQKLLSICEKSISDDDADENTKAHAAKMIEVWKWDKMELNFSDLHSPMPSPHQSTHSIHSAFGFQPTPKTG